MHGIILNIRISSTYPLVVLRSLVRAYIDGFYTKSSNAFDKVRYDISMANLKIMNLPELIQSY